MRDAAVGFQCPSCIAEGKKTTRSGRTPYGGVLRPGRQGIVSMSLIAINAAVWVLILATGGAASVWVDRLSLRPKGLCIVGNGGYDVSQSVCDAQKRAHMWLPGVSDGAWWQPVTSMFTHIEVWHIGFNMLALWVLGSQLEMVLGRVRYLGLYLLSGLVGSAVVYWLSPEYEFVLGASGAVFGLMGALLVLALKVRADVNQILVWIGINFAITFFGRGFISWQGHLGGFVGGALLAAILAYAPRQRRTLWQGAGFAAVFAVTITALVVRTLTLS